MGFFDLLGPLLSAADDILTSLPAWLRLLLWSAVASALTMKLYQWTSRQERMASLKAEAKAAQRELAGFDGEFDEMLPLMKRSIGASLRMLGLAIGPAVLASIPVVFVLAWAATRFAYDMPQPGSQVPVRVEAAAGTALSWEPQSALSTSAAGDQVVWPSPGESVNLSADGAPVLVLPVTAPSPVVHQRLWWNVLFANPAGYLPADGPVSAVHLTIPSRSYLPFGPGWVRSWLTLMLLGIFGFSILFKVWWKIH